MPWPDHTQEVARNLAAIKEDGDLKALSRMWARAVGPYKYVYNFSWMGRPIIQTPQDVMAMQELVFRLEPDLIVETGVAHGGSLIMYASLLELLGGDRRVLGLDIEIRPHNRAAIEAHRMAHRIDLLEGSSIAPEVVAQVHERAAKYRKVMVVLDSNHTHAHVKNELLAYAPLVRQGSYVVVFDTLIEELPDTCFPDRPWRKGNSPGSAVTEFLQGNQRFEVDTDLDAKLLISAAPGGYLRCVRDP
jgi:cephalosporin hydroxylase